MILWNWFIKESITFLLLSRYTASEELVRLFYKFAKPSLTFLVFVSFLEFLDRFFNNCRFCLPLALFVSFFLLVRGLEVHFFLDFLKILLLKMMRIQSHWAIKPILKRWPTFSGKKKFIIFVKRNLVISQINPEIWDTLLILHQPIWTKLSR